MLCYFSECRQSLRLCRHFFMRMLSAGMFSACSLRIMLFPQESALKKYQKLIIHFII
ncbi:hypothetical protein ACW7DJ_07595 [Mammaliicoccus sciuri]